MSLCFHFTFSKLYEIINCVKPNRKYKLLPEKTIKYVLLLHKFLNMDLPLYLYLSPIYWEQLSV